MIYLLKILRVPLIQAFPWHTSGSTIILSLQFMLHLFHMPSRITVRVFEKGKAFDFYPQTLCYLPSRAFPFKMNYEGLTLHSTFDPPLHLAEVKNVNLVVDKLVKLICQIF